MSQIKILALGDVVGENAVEYIRRRLGRFSDDNAIDFTVINGENACMGQGNGIDVVSAKTLLQSGADVITSGNHIWHKKDMREYLDSTDLIIRPANYQPSMPGQGYTKVNCQGYTMLVINVLGVIYIDPLDSPFTAVEQILEREEGRYDFAVLDIHAEATSEKYALARYFDGRIHAMFGTHTHIPTADNQVLKKGSGFVCDLGMCGPVDSILGVKNECIIERLVNGVQQKFELAEGEIEANGVIFTLDTDSKKCLAVDRIKF